MNILEEFYYGNVHPGEKIFMRDSAHVEYTDLISANEEKLNEHLGEEDKQLFAQLMDAQGEIQCMEGLEWFVEGFQLGARFMLDTFLMPRNHPPKVMNK